MNVSRRHLLAMIPILALSQQALASEANTSNALLGLLDDRQTAAALGALWLRNSQQQPGAVLESLQSRLSGQGWSGAADTDQLRQAFAAAVTDDFRTGDMIVLQGWQVARTQAELCALAYFTATGDL
jgi:hypothetical protein